MSSNYPTRDDQPYESEDPELEALIHSFGHVGISEPRLAAFLNMSPQALRAKLTEQGSVLSVAIQAYYGEDRIMRYRHVYSFGFVQRYRGAYGVPHESGGTPMRKGPDDKDDDFGGLDEYGSFMTPGVK